MLFCGPPGTGKTMSAEVIANELNKDLWVASIARMQSSFVGQSEQIIESLFRSAQAAGAVLLLDECDSFLKSREMINNEHTQKLVNHLLMLIADFKGILIMTTNYADNLDSAISRRIDMKLFLDAPGEKEKFLILERLLFPDAPLEKDLNLEEIVKGLKLTGGLIKNGVERAFMKMVGEGKEKMNQTTLREAMESIERENELVNRQKNDYIDKQEGRIGL